MTSKRNGQGNAMVEFLLVAAVLVPIVLCIPRLGKLGDLNQTGVQATRYALWERTVSDTGIKSDAVLLEEIKLRVMQRDDAAIATGDSVDNSASETSLSYSTDGNDSLAPPAPGAMLLLTRNEELTGAEGTKMFTDAINTVGKALDGVISGADWDVEQGGLVTVEFAMAIDPNGSNPADCAESTDTAPCWRRGHTMLMDSWQAADPAAVARRAKAFVPAGVLAPVGDALSLLGAIPLFEELEKLDGAFGTLDPDVVPLDRFGDE